MSCAEGFEEFVAVVETGSIRAAADQLSLPRPTVSRRLARLEERLGVRLLHRTTRRQTLTARGEALFERARQVVLAARDAEAEVRRLDGVPRGLLRVAMPTQTPNALMAGWFDDYLERYPEVSVEVIATEAKLDLAAEGIHVALRFGPQDPSLVARTLLTVRSVAVASPAYLQKRGTPRTPSELGEHACIVGFEADRVPTRRWPLRDGGTVGVGGRMVADQMSLWLHLAVLGRGIALVSERLARPFLADGRLVTVLEADVGRVERVSVVFVDRRYVDPKVRAFVDLLVEAFGALRE